MRAADVARGSGTSTCTPPRIRAATSAARSFVLVERLFTSILSGKNEVHRQRRWPAGASASFLNATRDEVRYGRLRHRSDADARSRARQRRRHERAGAVPPDAHGDERFGNQPLTPDQVTKLTNAGLYANFHSMEFRWALCGDRSRCQL